MTQLRTCPGCARHVLNHEPSCPFCEQKLDAAPERAPIKVPSNLSRAQRLTLAAAMAGQAVSACTETAVPVYGAPIAGDVAPSAGSGGTGTSSGGRHAGQAGTTAGVGMAVAIYGAPLAGNPASGPAKDAGASDAGSKDAGMKDAGMRSDAAADDDAGSASDAGTKKDGGIMVQPLYGAPAPAYGLPPTPPKK